MNLERVLECRKDQALEAERLQEHHHHHAAKAIILLSLGLGCVLVLLALWSDAA